MTIKWHLLDIQSWPTPRLWAYILLSHMMVVVVVVVVVVYCNRFHAQQMTMPVEQYADMQDSTETEQGTNNNQPDNNAKRKHT